MSNYRHEETKYGAIGAAILLVTAFVLVQPMQTTYAQVSDEGIPQFDDCDIRSVPEDPISQNTIKKKDVVKTIHAEKEIFDCLLNQGTNFSVIVDVTTYIELYVNITEQEVIETNVIVTSCVKDENTADIYGCEVYTPTEDTIPVSACEEQVDGITHPQEMDTVNKGNNALTIETQKEVFLCDFDLLGTGTILKKIDLVIFTEIYENLSSQTIQDVQAHAMKCTVLVTDNNPTNTRRDATVESCVFSEVQVDGPF